MHVRLTLEHKPDNRTVAILATMDVSARKAAETALTNSEKKYRRLVELAQEGIWALDKQANTTFANPSMARMLGYTLDEMVGKPFFACHAKGRRCLLRPTRSRSKNVP